MGSAVFEGLYPDLEVKWATFGIESMHGMQDAENNHRDYGIERKFWSG